MLEITAGYADFLRFRINLSMNGQRAKGLRYPFFSLNPESQILITGMIWLYLLGVILFSASICFGKPSYWVLMSIPSEELKTPTILLSGSFLLSRMLETKAGTISVPQDSPPKIRSRPANSECFTKNFWVN